MDLRTSSGGPTNIEQVGPYIRWGRLGTRSLVVVAAEVRARPMVAIQAMVGTEAVPHLGPPVFPADALDQSPRGRNAAPDVRMLAVLYGRSSGFAYPARVMSQPMTEVPVAERLTQLFDALGIQQAHVAAGYGPHAAALASAYPERLTSLSLVCPGVFEPEAASALGGRVLYIHGDRGPSVAQVTRVIRTLSNARAVTLPEYFDALWSDAVADRPAEIGSTLLQFLHELTDTVSTPPTRLPEDVGECAGIRYQIRGNGPPLVLLPLNLARSQWEPLIDVLAEHYTTITLGGAFLGFVPNLEQRVRGGYGTVVREVVQQADPRPGETLLEVGCGSGATTRLLARLTHGANPIIAVDVNGYLLREAGALAQAEGLADGITFREDDAERLRLADDSVDVSLSFTVMEEVDADRMLSEMIRVTRPGGRIGIVVRAADMAWWTNLPLSPEQLARIAAAPSPGAADNGCADASLYRRFQSSGLRDLHVGPRLGTYRAEHGAEVLGGFTRMVLQNVDSADAAECRTILARAVDEKTLLWAQPFHCAVGTKI
jgi:ubiquinone/menaquinone biosynthesis C-methylase UbiE